jgi:hypothetical protein
LIGEINGAPAKEHFLARFLTEVGFHETMMGYQMRRVTAMAPSRDAEDHPEQNDQHLSESA